MVVQEIQTSQDFDRIVYDTNNIVVVEFYATWCGPCKAIAPVFITLSEHPKFSDIIFIKVDVDHLRSVASKAKISSMPTFVVYMNGTEAERISGANRQQLEFIIEKYSSMAVSIKGKESKDMKGFYPLNCFVDVRQLDCLNMDKKYPSRCIFEKEGYLQSDVDEQLLLYIPFKSTVRIFSLVLECKNQKQAPSCLSLYINMTSLPSFDDVSDSGVKPTQRIEEISYDADGCVTIPLRFVKFQRVVSLVLFVEANQDDEVSRIDNLTIVGETVEEAVNNGIVQKMEE
ncbi:thioredoxin [Pneumocystis carinii B80]|uniref:Thioredoxin n=1 Tax=Pneumocystis carinii (strain B80) TaxID=1408658 RepID=A0A0W4ZSR8_PNEC8|nr:thioredoxin [Pneumocystis carinii B80]KTW31432.1 thioredoxin [Pneumocystis carinii B80]